MANARASLIRSGALWAAVGGALVTLPAGSAQAQSSGLSGRNGTDPAACTRAIAAAEQDSAIPAHILQAIGRAESGRPDAASGQALPWPWTINVEGRGYFFDSREQAVEAVRDFTARGVASIDVGCMQVNLAYHPAAFASLDQAFDPVVNVSYAARFLRRLYAETGDWTQATAFYHSRTPDLAMNYERRVFGGGRLTWPIAAEAALGRNPGPPRPSALKSAWEATLGPVAADAGRIGVWRSSRNGTAPVLALAQGGLAWCVARPWTSRAGAFAAACRDGSHAPGWGMRPGRALARSVLAPEWRRGPARRAG